jgi:hypothetical protein
MRHETNACIVLAAISIIDFAPAAPVLVQEKRHGYVDAMHILAREVIIVLGNGPGMKS